MKNTELAYDYHTTAALMDARGYNMEEIEAFLIRNQNESGYIKSSAIPESYSDAHESMMGDMI